MRGRLFAALAGIGLLLFGASALAQSLKVVETSPVDKATVETLGEGVFVRFDQPIDHIRSRLYIMRGDEKMATLHPRFKTEPNVLFAQAPILASGSYVLQWSVRNLEGSEVVEGQISFSIKVK